MTFDLDFLIQPGWMPVDAQPLFDSLLLTEQMPWWHNADIEQAKKKKKKK